MLSATLAVPMAREEIDNPFADAEVTEEEDRVYPYAKPAREIIVIVVLQKDPARQGWGQEDTDDLLGDL
jgi:hypothetical protein